MISLNTAISELNISIKKIRYYMFTKEINYFIKDNKFYLSEQDYELLKKIVLFRRLGLSLEDIDEIKKSNNLNKTLLKMYNLIPDGNKYENIKIIIDDILKDKATFITIDAKKYIDKINKLMFEGKRFYMFKEDITYEDYKSSKFNFEYISMITIVTLFFILVAVFSKNDQAFIMYFPFFFIGLLLTLFIFFIPIKIKYYRRIINLLKRNYFEKMID